MSNEHEVPAAIRYVVDDIALAVEQFLDLVQRVWPGTYHLALAQQALRRTTNITAW